MLRPDDRLLDLLLRRDLVISYRREVASRLEEIFPGQEMQPLRHALREIHRRLRDARLFVALHMHAGDGNVHSNIPVHSDNYAMLQQADRIVRSHHASRHLPRRGDLRRTRHRYDQTAVSGAG